MNRDEAKQLVYTLEPTSPELLNILAIAKENGWDDIKEMIAGKLGLTATKEQIRKPRLKTLKVSNSWDYSVDFNEAKKALTTLYKQLYDANKMPDELYVAILLVQLTNGMRVREAIRAFRLFMETQQREMTMQSQKRGGTRFVIIPSLVKYKISYNYIYAVDEGKLRKRLHYFAKKWLGVNTHSLRYAFVSHLAKSGVDPSVIAKITGHKQLSRIITYTQQKDALDILRKIAQ